MANIPQCVLDYNKSKGKNRILPLSQCKSLYLKRFFSGSFGVDRVLGGGAAFKRIQMLYGARSAGKNALLNQLMAYNQRICRHCKCVLPQYQEESDRWADVLAHIIGIPYCTCNNPQPRTILFYDFEKTLSIEDARTVQVLKYFKKGTDEEVSGNDYNEKLVRFDELKEKGRLVAEEKKEMAELELWFEGIETFGESVEHMNSADYLQACGVQTDNLHVMTPETSDEGIDSLTPMIKSKEIDIIIWDSIQASMTGYVSERSAADATMGSEAKMNGLMMRKINSAYTADNIDDESDAYKPPVWITSQIRASIGFLHAADTFSGGKAFEHALSSALELRRGKWLSATGGEAKKGDPYFGQEVNIKAEKNKLAAPFSRCTYNYYFKGCEAGPVGFIDYFDELISIAVEAGIVGQGGGGNYTFKDYKVRGRENLVSDLKKDPNLLSSIYSEVKNIG